MFTGFVNVYDPPWPSRVKNLEVSTAYTQANERTSVVLDKIKSEQQRIEAEELALRAEHDDRVAKEKAIKTKLKTLTAEEQRKQIEDAEKERKRLEERKKEPGISKECHGYPSIPETPPHIRRARKLTQQQHLKEELERQAANNRLALEAQRERDQHLDKMMLQAAEAVGRDRLVNDETKKKKNREDMRTSWKQAEDYKQAQSVLASPFRSLETSSISQHSWSEYRDRFQDYKPVLSVSSPLTASVTRPLPPPQSQSPSITEAKSTVSVKLTNDQRKKIAERLKEEEERKAKASIEMQMQRMQPGKIHSTSPLKTNGYSSPKMLGKSSHLKSVGGLITSSAMMRSYSQPHIAPTKKNR